MTDKPVRVSQDIIDIARAAKSFIAQSGEDSVLDELLMRAAVTFNMLHRRGIWAGHDDEDGQPCERGQPNWKEPGATPPLAFVTHRGVAEIPCGPADTVFHRSKNIISTLRKQISFAWGIPKGLRAFFASIVPTNNLRAARHYGRT